MGYDVSDHNSYGHHTISCSAFCRRSDTKTQGHRMVVVGLRRNSVDIVRSPCDVRTESLYVLIENARRSYGSRRVSADF